METPVSVVQDISPVRRRRSGRTVFESALSLNERRVLWSYNRPWRGVALDWHSALDPVSIVERDALVVRGRRQRDRHVFSVAERMFVVVQDQLWPWVLTKLERIWTPDDITPAGSSFSILVVDGVFQPLVHVLLAETVVRGSRTLEHTGVSRHLVFLTERPIVAFLPDETPSLET